MIPRWVAVQAEMAKRSCRRGSRGPEDLSQWRLDNGRKQPGLQGQENGDTTLDTM